MVQQKFYLTRGYKKHFYLIYPNPSTGKLTRTVCKTEDGENITSKKDAEKFKLQFQLNQLQQQQSNSILPPKLEKLLQSYQENKPPIEQPVQPSISISQFVDTLIPLLNLTVPQSQRGFRNLFKKLIEFLGDTNVYSISEIDIENYKNWRHTKVSMASVNIEIRSLKAIFNKAIRWKVLIDKVNPVNGVLQFKVPQKERMSFTLEELDKILNVATNNRIKFIIQFAYYSGCRLSEIIHLQWNDVDFSNKIIHIRNKEGWTTKTKMNRKIPITDKMDSLFQFMANEKYSNPSHLQSYVFCKENGFRYEAGYVSRKFKKYLREVGMEKFHFHCLRHTFAFHLLRACNNIYYAKRILGHTSLTTTQIYVDATTDDLRDAMNQV